MVATLLRENPSFFPFLREFPSIKWQPLKISKIGIDNFLEILIRMIHAKFQTSMTMLRRVDAFCVISQKKGFSLYKGNLRDFEGEMSGSSQIIIYWNSNIITGKITLNASSAKTMLKAIVFVYIFTLFCELA